MTPNSSQRVLVLGATGTIGRATVRGLVERGHEAVCLVRRRAGHRGSIEPEESTNLLRGAVVRFGDATEPASLARDGICGERFDAMVSCMASRTGAPEDEDDGSRRMAVNIRLAPPEEVADLPIDHFDGLGTFTDLPSDGQCVRDLWF